MRLILCLALATLSACHHPEAARHRERIDAIAARHDAELEAFELEKAAFARRTPIPQERDVPGMGKLVVRECRLLGWPGKVYLRVQFTYVNTTGATVDTPRVTLSVESPDGVDFSRSSIDLVVPFATELTKNSTYSSWLDVDTEGIHRLDDWVWRLDLAPASEAAAER